jgi:LemA protein
MYVALGFVVIVVLVLLWGVITYNRFISLGKKCEESWSDVLVQLKRRHDLVPNLVNAVKGYMAHEKVVLEEVTKFRAINAGESVTKTAESENMFTQALGKLFAVAENYPDLKAGENFLSLQRTMYEVEDEIQMSRRYYNGTVRNYNTLVEMFPSLIVAKMFSFMLKDFFELENPNEREVPEVSF